MDSGAISHNRRLERHSKHAARHPDPSYDFTNARPAHLNARDAALEAIISDVEQRAQDKGADFDLRRGLLGDILGGHSDEGDGGSHSGSGSNSYSHGGSHFGGLGSGGDDDEESSSSSASPTVSKCTSRGSDGLCLTGGEASSTTSRSTTSSSARSTSTTPTPTSTRTTSSSTRSTSTTPSSTSTSTRSTSSSVSTTSLSTTSSSSSQSPTSTRSSATAVSSSTTLITMNGTTRTSVAFVTANTAPQASSTTTSQDDGPGAGPIVGIVAGSLAGVAILSALIGFIWKRYSKKNEDQYEGNPFGGSGDRDDYRRGSTMLPDDTYIDDDEFNAPSMSEHGTGVGGISNGHGSFGADSVMMAGAAGMGVAAGGAGMVARNESGAPRPPTMFARHLAQVSNKAAPPLPNAAEMYQGNEVYPDAYPQLPPMAFGAGGQDPYSMNQNISNPYAHLDRAQNQAAEGYYSDLDRSGSQGSQQSSSKGSNHRQLQGASPGQFGHQDSFTSAQDERDFDTSGRPGTAEGRSGTPELPNMQQTFTMDSSSVGHTVGGSDSMIGSSTGNNNVGHSGHLSRELLTETSPSREGPFNEGSPINSGKATVSHQLSVRNLMPNPHEQQPSGRPLSSVSSAADPDDIYGGIY